MTMYLHPNMAKSVNIPTDTDINSMKLASNLVDFWKSTSTPNLADFPRRGSGPSIKSGPIYHPLRKKTVTSSSTHDITILLPGGQMDTRPSLHLLKVELSRRQIWVQEALDRLSPGDEPQSIQAFQEIAKTLQDVWAIARIGDDIAYGLCDYLRDNGALDLIISTFQNEELSDALRMAAGGLLEESLSEANLAYLDAKAELTSLIQSAMHFSAKSGSEKTLCLSVTLIEASFRLSEESSLNLIRFGAVDHLVRAIKKSCHDQTHRHAALALANLAIYSDSETQHLMVDKNVQDWLFMLAAMQDDITRYYACLAICVLTTNTEIETAIIRSGTLQLVEPFLLFKSPEDLASTDYRHSKYRPKEWLRNLLPVLNSKRKEARSLAAYHFAMEAGIKANEEEMQIFQEIGAIEALKAIASSPDEVAPKFARHALKIIGEEVPHKLSQQVPLWSTKDVVNWVSQIGFKQFADNFQEQMVDGDLLLLITEDQLQNDLSMSSSLQRKRFMRELHDLKVAADYTCVDDTDVDKFLTSINPYFSAYSYRLIKMGVDKTSLPVLTDAMLKEFASIENPIHRHKILQVAREWREEDHGDSKFLRSKDVDVFISYRRSTGSQLASLIRTMLQLRGYRVFIDVDRLQAGTFDSSLIQNIRSAKHFLLILSPGALDRCLDDDSCQDWVHKEMLCAMQSQRHIIPIVDPGFTWPEDDERIPRDIRTIRRFNGIQWVHEYQEACVDKLERFLKGDYELELEEPPLDTDHVDFDLMINDEG